MNEIEKDYFIRRLDEQAETIRRLNRNVLFLTDDMKNNKPNKKKNNKKKGPGLKEFDANIFFKGLMRYPVGHLIVFGLGMVAGAFL